MLRRLLPGDQTVASGCQVPTRAVSTGLFLAGQLPSQGAIGGSACCGRRAGPQSCHPQAPRPRGSRCGPGSASRPSASLPEMPAWEQQQSNQASGRQRLGVRSPGLLPPYLLPPPYTYASQNRQTGGCGQAQGWSQAKNAPARPPSLTRLFSACSALGDGTPGQGCLSFFRHPRRSSSLLQGRSPSLGRRSSTWLVPLTCSVSSGIGWGLSLPQAFYLPLHILPSAPQGLKGPP